MYWLALKMLLGHRTRYLTMIFGLTFASLLIAQQVSIFLGVLRLTTGQIRDIEDVDIWVVSPHVSYIDDLEPLPEWRVQEVQSIAGVRWAVPLYKGMTRAYLADGRYQQLLLVGVDNVSLVGAPQNMLLGTVADLDKPDAVILDEIGTQILWPDEPIVLGREFTIGDRRAELVGVCKISLTFQTLPVAYCQARDALGYLPPSRRSMSAVLVRAIPGENIDDLCQKISAQTGLLAQTPQQFANLTMNHYMSRTGLLANFATLVGMGFLVGIAIAGQSFYNFTVENLAYYGMLKAMGVTNQKLIRMVALQATLISGIGYGMGVGLAAIFGELTKGHSKLVFFMPWHVLVGTGIAVLLISLGASLLSIGRILRAEAAIVIRS
jgi:putative ABC transport system permease protein